MNTITVKKEIAKRAPFQPILYCAPYYKGQTLEVLDSQLHYTFWSKKLDLSHSRFICKNPDANSMRNVYIHGLDVEEFIEEAGE